MSRLTRHAWTLLLVSLFFDAISAQVFFVDLSGRGVLNRAVFAIGGLLGDLPVILLVGVVLDLIVWVVRRERVSTRLFALCIAIGCWTNLALIHPLLIALEQSRPTSSEALAPSNVLAAASAAAAASPQPIMPAAPTDEPITVAMEDDHGTFRVPVVINNAITLPFTIDSGASDVNIPADVALTLYRAGTISRADFIGNATFTLADGTTVPSPVFRLRALKVGTLELRDVVASVSDQNGSLLLGQSFLSRLSSWSIDNSRHTLVLNTAPGTAQASLAPPTPPAQLATIPTDAEPNGASTAPADGATDHLTSDVSQAAAAARDRALAYYASWSGQDAQSIADARPYYASSVRFYGRQLDVDQLMAEVMAFAERWPVRNYTVREPLNVSCQDEHTCLVQGVSDWDASDPASGRQLGGTAQFSIVFHDGLIVTEDGKDVLRR